MLDWISLSRITCDDVVDCTRLIAFTGMKTALEILGYPTYHAFNLWADSEDHIKGWNRAMDAKYHGKGTFTRYDWDEILGQYTAIVDAPASFFAVELAEAYPDAKVVVLNRDPEAWLQSCQAAFTHRKGGGFTSFIYQILTFWQPRLRTLALHMNRKQKEIWQFEWHEDCREKALAFFENYYADCRARIPAERMLEYRVQDGWKPLCDHLGVEVPTLHVDGSKERVEMPFPRTNESAEFNKLVNGIKTLVIKQSLRDWADRIVLSVAIGYSLYRALPPFLGWAMRFSPKSLFTQTR